MKWVKQTMYSKAQKYW